MKQQRWTILSAVLGIIHKRCKKGSYHKATPHAFGFLLLEINVRNERRAAFFYVNSRQVMSIRAKSIDK